MDYRGGNNQTADRGYVLLFGCRSKSVGAALASAAYSYTPALYVTQKRRCSCGMRFVALYVLYTFAFAFALLAN